MKGFLLCIGLILLCPILTSAQFTIDFSSSLTDELSVEVIPEYPGPNQTVYVTIASYSDDLNSATVSWYLDGKLAKEGTGVKSFSWRTGAIGKESTIEVRVSFKSGARITKNFTITPATVALAWEADTYTPLFYQGKALHTPQGRLKIVAMPEFVKNGVRISPQNLIYQWSDGVEAYDSQSGYGRSSFVIDGNILGIENTVELLVTDPTHNLVAESSITIDPSDPEILFYENDPYYGYLYEQALGSSVELKRDEIQVVVSPYYVSRENRGIQYSWRLNGQDAPQLETSQTAIFRRPDDSRGTSIIDVEVKNARRVLQFAEGSLSIRFDE